MRLNQAVFFNFRVRVRVGTKTVLETIRENDMREVKREVKIDAEGYLKDSKTSRGILCPISNAEPHCTINCAFFSTEKRDENIAVGCTIGNAIIGILTK